MHFKNAFVNILPVLNADLIYSETNYSFTRNRKVIYNSRNSLTITLRFFARCSSSWWVRKGTQKVHKRYLRNELKFHSILYSRGCTGAAVIQLFHSRLLSITKLWYFNAKSCFWWHRTAHAWAVLLQKGPALALTGITHPACQGLTFLQPRSPPFCLLSDSRGTFVKSSHNLGSRGASFLILLIEFRRVNSFPLPFL